MAEQNEIKKVITVDLGNSTTSLKDYKKHIDELRGSLLQLDETSEEYQKIAQEITQEQNKLNEVMKVGKQQTEAADGSYNKLVQTMAELKAQWKATGDEVERAELGAKILDINNQLKELDASTGNYQRNVGDYTNAFEKAFDKCLDGVKKIDGPIGELGGTVKQMIPVIKSINATALTGLSGIKKAIASTGIGLLVVAVGELAAHWEDVKKTIGNLIGVQRNYTSEVEASKKAMDDFKEAVDEANKKIEYQDKLLAAQGATNLERLENQLQSQREILWNLREQYAKEINYYNLYKDDDYQERADEIYKQIEAQEKLIKETQKEIDIEKETLKKAAEERLEIIEFSLKSEEEKLKIQYEKDIALAEQYNLDKTAIETKYQKDLEDLRKKSSDKNDSTTKTNNNTAIDLDKKKAETIIENLRQANQTEIEKLEEKYNQEKALLEKYGLDTTELTKKYEADKKAIIQKLEDKRFENSKNNFDAEAEQLKFNAEIEIDNAQSLAAAKYQIEQDLINKKIALQQQYIEEYKGNQEGLFEAENELEALRQEKENNRRQYEKETTEYVKKLAQEEKQYKMEALNATFSLASTIFGALADLAEDGSKQQKELQIAQVTINTLAGAVGAFLQCMSSYPAPYGAIMGGIAAATATAAGVAQIVKIRSTNTSGSSSISSPSTSIQVPSMTEVNPLLDEQGDINRIELSGVQGNSKNETQNLRVYVVDQDIRDANKKADVVEQNTTF